MYCKKCGSIAYDNAQTCSTCGATIENQNNVEVPNSTNNSNTTDTMNGVVSQEKAIPPTLNSTINIEALMDNYIGKNVIKLRTGNFSFCSFFYGPLYSLYRKMWVQGFLWLLASTLAEIFLGNFSYAVTLIISIAVSANFKPNYLKKVQENVIKIKNENIDKSQEQLAAICRQKGGTTIVPIVISIILFALLITFTASLIMKMFNAAKEDAFKINNNTEEYDDSKIGTLKYTIPEEFEKGEYFSSFNPTYEREDKSGCEINFYKTFSELYDNNIENYFHNTIFLLSDDTKSEIKEQKINNKSWSKVSVTSSTSINDYYAIENGGLIYRIIFSYPISQTDNCTGDFKEVLDSLKFN